MTMIAGFKLDEVPFLIGDLVTSVPDPLTGGRSRHLAKKKTAILSRNCAVGWTGSVLSAGMILDELFERFRNVDVTRSDIEDYLKNREPDGMQAEVRLVLWVVEAEPSLFMWVSTASAMVFEYEPIVAGSGEATFASLQILLEMIRFPQLGVMEKLAKALMHYSELLTLEVKEPDPTFGFAYEVAAFLDGKFAYLSKFLFCDIRAECTSESDVRTSHAVIFGSFVYEFEHEPNVTCLTWIDGQKAEAEVKLVTPPGRRPWIKAAEDRWAERVNEDSNAILGKLVGNPATYCVRVTLYVDGRALRPVHFIYDRLTLGNLDRDKAAVVEPGLDGSNISFKVDYGPNFKSFMMARG